MMNSGSDRTSEQGLNGCHPECEAWRDEAERLRTENKKLVRDLDGLITFLHWVADGSTDSIREKFSRASFEVDHFHLLHPGGAEEADTALADFRKKDR